MIILHHLVSQLEVVLTPLGGEVKVEYALTEARCLADADVAIDDRVEDEALKVLLDVLIDQIGRASCRERVSVLV